ncbi:HU family DNA-binding protein [candidate division WOR-3 bacterium]|jgi:DNA-binding protein HU-beta|nr:HU family DNA-binding protein [candidate division WOR-3 bacterium]MCK4756428.1 HU family DNA-binding protein [candidate division WOR-3 bacterium]NOR16529.1 DNA-binding protein HU [candidate division WOR-3 bacterium]
MTKAELIDKIAAKAKISKKAANVALNTFVDSVTSALKKGDRVSLVGFGTFTVAKRKARIARNPRTGEKINVPARRAAKFKAGRELKNAVR